MYLKNILHALKFVWQSSRKWTVLLLVTQLMQAILPLVGLYLIKLIVDSLTEVGANSDFRPAIQYVLMLGGVQLLAAIIENYQQLINETQQQLVSDYMATVIIDQAVDIDISYYENSDYHDTLHQAQRQALNRPILILQNLSKLLWSSFLLVSLAGLLIFCTGELLLFWASFISIRSVNYFLIEMKDAYFSSVLIS
ncbi:MAG: ATP-binding cassette subfamily B protein [Saprospiraceae bacterium]|jgi:ATP-binding cassette subfamily B protein